MAAGIEVHHIHKSYQSAPALQDVSFSVEEGEIFGLIGPDGAGKTSLFRILATLLLPDKGQGRVAGYDVVDEYRHVRQKVGYMPGRFSLYMDLTVEENLQFFATIFDTTIAENYHLIKEIYQQIEPFKDRRAGDLSGGMKQKLALSCALIHEPAVLFLDEPTTGVDPVSRKEFWDMLKRLQERGITILVSTPYMDEAALCDRIALIQKGKILRIDKPTAISGAYPRKLYHITSNQMHRLARDLRTYQYHARAYPSGAAVHYTDERNTTNAEHLQAFLADKGHDNIDITEAQPTIEDTFMELSNTANEAG